MIFFFLSRLSKKNCYQCEGSKNHKIQLINKNRRKIKAGMTLTIANKSGVWSCRTSYFALNLLFNYDFIARCNVVGIKLFVGISHFFGTHLVFVGLINIIQAHFIVRQSKELFKPYLEIRHISSEENKFNVILLIFNYFLLTCKHQHIELQHAL